MQPYGKKFHLLECL